MNNITLIDSYMTRMHAYGHYTMNFFFEYEDQQHNVVIMTTDSELWDDEDRTADDMIAKIGGIENLLNYID